LFPAHRAGPTQDFVASQIDQSQSDIATLALTADAAQWTRFHASEGPNLIRPAGHALFDPSQYVRRDRSARLINASA
jgi:hypothetical protein